jgi:choline kinase
MLGMILAAGAGRRLRPYTDTLPKALVPVDGETTIMDIALGNLAAVDLRRVLIVVGYRAEAVEARRAEMEKRYGVEIELVHNDKAEIWNNAYSMWLACDHIGEGVLMVNGDTVHPVGVEETLLASRGEGRQILLAVDTEKRLAEEEMKVQATAEGVLSRITKLMDPSTAFGEYIGATLIEPAAVGALKSSLQAVWERDPDLYYEDGYQEYSDRGNTVDLISIPAGTSWVEVDNHDDLLRAREIACHY